MSAVSVTSEVSRDVGTDTKATPPPLLSRNDHDRLSLPFPTRLALCLFCSSTAGFGLGSYHGGQAAGLRFRAENAHRLPTSEVGWFLYHKSKNYHAALGGVKEGLRMGAKLAVWGGLFLWMEEGVDRMRGAVIRGWVGFQDRRRIEKGWEDVGLERVEDEQGLMWVQRDFLSTTIAALSTAGAFSAWNRFPLPTAARTAKMGLKVGVAFGLMQDLLGYMRGRRLGYIEFAKRRLST
ncbi:hypothetical protein CAC42_2888 [Sphaceloma murrayae]|uniref:Uncharacterized protein n=1 Tax=Sphaceloma murrayae TaxID=2082308 RepID=A0A2K1R0Z6_9PEZI|nr:hypothetical protein CAC42_2888 [Sphaceloma murrayae]